MKVFSLTLMSVVCCLLSIAIHEGSDGLLIERPSHTIALRGAPVRFECTSDRHRPYWYQLKYADKQSRLIRKRGCAEEEQRSLDDGPSYTCDLLLEPDDKVFSGGLSMNYVCVDYKDARSKEGAAYAILVVLESPLKCETQENKLSCSLKHSAYKNKTEMFQYLEISLVLTDPDGRVVSSKSAGFNKRKTVVTATLDGTESFQETSPYSCSVRFKWHCDEFYEDDCVEDITIVSPDAVNCKFDVPDDCPE